MVNYGNGKIYKIESHLGDKVYIGSTTKQYLSQRMDTHRSKYKQWKKQKGPFIRSYAVFDEYGLENCNIVLLESCSCTTKDELFAMEAYYIKTLNCVNKVIPGRTLSEWCENNSDHLKEYRKEYREKHKDKIKEYQKIYSVNNCEKLKEKQNSSCECSCGLFYTMRNKARHEKSKLHLTKIDSLNKQ